METQENTAAAETPAAATVGDVVQQGTSAGESVGRQTFPADPQAPKPRTADQLTEGEELGRQDGRLVALPIPVTVGRTVLYTLSQADAENINRRRGANTGADNWPQGAVAHVGNYAYAGDVVPLTVVRVWQADMVNGQATLDGNDSLWVTSAHKAAGESEQGCWHWPPRV
jgi:hypothetical protein